MAMKKWKPAPPDAAAAFSAATKRVVGLERRKMFGYDATFANNRMVAGLHEVGMVLRLSDDDRERFTTKHEGQPFVVMGRVMREYVVVPESLYADTPTLTGWVKRGLAYAESMPAKAKAKKRSKTKASR
jgi:TfoX/Sxy family transcriptional regulator of competence genes